MSEEEIKALVIRLYDRVSVEISGHETADIDAVRAADTIQALFQKITALELRLAVSQGIEKKLADLLLHAWVHSGYPNCGYEDMTYEQKTLYDTTINKTFAQKDGGNG